MSTQSRLELTTMAALGGLFLGACGIVTGVDKYEVVDCPSGSCSDASSTDAATEAATGGDASVDSAPDVIRLTCRSDEAQITIVVGLDVGTHVLVADKGLDVAPGETKAFCARSDGGGGGERLETSPSVAVTWTGTNCGRTNRCDFTPSAPLTITVSP